MVALLLFRRWPLYHETCINFCLPEKSKCQNDMFCFPQLMSPPSKCYFSICIVPHCTPHRQNACGYTSTHTHKLHPENYITSLPLSENYICPSPFHQSLPRSPFFFLLFPSLSPFLTILGLSLHFTSALNCQAWIALWTAWGGQAGRRCVWMRESLCYHHLFSFSSPSGAVRSQTRYHSPPAPPTGSHNTTSRKWNKRIKTKVNKMVAFQTPAPLPYPTNPMTLFVL